MMPLTYLIEQWSMDGARLKQVLGAAMHKETAEAMVEAARSRFGGELRIADGPLPGGLGPDQFGLINHIELWTPDDLNIEQNLASTVSPIMALAAYRAELKRWPGRVLRMRQNNWVMADSTGLSI